MMRLSLMILTSLFANSAIAAPSTNNVMQDFRFQNCGTDKICWEVTSLKAWVSFVTGAFSTDGRATVRKLDSQGAVLATYDAATANYNSTLQLITAENADGGFMLISLKDGLISDYGFAASKGVNNGAK